MNFESFEKVAEIEQSSGPEQKELPDDSGARSRGFELPDDSGERPGRIELPDDFGEKIIPQSPEDYHRPYLRQETKAEIFNRAVQDKNGSYLDPNTGLPIVGTPDIGHKPGHEHWREAQRAYDHRLSQAEFNDRMNNPDYYQLEDPSSNRSHKFEDKSSYQKGEIV